MTDSVKIALIATIAPTLVAVGGLVSSLRNRTKLKALHVDINSRLTQLLSATGARERAEGVLEGRNLGVAEENERRGD